MSVEDVADISHNDINCAGDHTGNYASHVSYV